MMSECIDQRLHQGKRSLRTLPRSILLGSTGARLWADYLDPAAGFAGSIDFIHKTNIPVLFRVRCDEAPSLEPAQFEWYPSHLQMAYENGRVSLHEYKFITWDDCAVSCQTWKNLGNVPIALTLDGIVALSSSEHGVLHGSTVIPRDGYSIRIELLANGGWEMGRLTVEPSAEVVLILTAALGVDGQDTPDDLGERLRTQFFTGQGVEELVEAQTRQYQKWFDGAPSFASSDPLLDKTWWYRWFLLRHNTADPRYGNLKYPLFYEGRSHKMSKTPNEPSGWEFSKLIPLSVPLHLLDARWHRDISTCMGALDDLVAGQDADGLYHCRYVDKTLAAYANFIGWASYQLYLIHPKRRILDDVLPSLKKQVSGWASVFGSDSNHLLIDRVHQLTGKEYQPSFWYFSGFPDDCRDPDLITPLKRVDRNVYYYLNALGVAELCRLSGDPEEQRFREIAARIRKDILDWMWDPKTRFFYDLHHETDEPAIVKNVVGFYPYWAGIAEERHEAGLEKAFSPQFDTPCPFPSVSTDTEVFEPAGGWKGNFIKGRNGCVWDGPTWPYTDAVVLDAIATESRRRGHRFDGQFARLLREYSFLHYRSHDLSEPYLVEHYNSMTGEPLSDEVDYNHSYYIDIVIRQVVGLFVTDRSIRLDPLHVGLDYFLLDNLQVRGNTLRVSYRNPRAGNVPGEIDEGYNLYVNGALVMHSDELRLMEYSL